MILEGFSILTLCKLEPRFCWSLSKDLELFEGLLLTEFLVTSVILKFLVDIISFFAKLLEDTNYVIGIQRVATNRWPRNVTRDSP